MCLFTAVSEHSPDVGFAGEEAVLSEAIHVIEVLMRRGGSGRGPQRAGPVLAVAARWPYQMVLCLAAASAVRLMMSGCQKTHRVCYLCHS